MQFRQLRYFVAVVEAGSISRAATTVHVAQPALSQQIADLEERIGVQLLLRMLHGVKATSAGETLFREASLILHRMDKLPSLLKSAIGEQHKAPCASASSPALQARWSASSSNTSRLHCRRSI